MVRNGSPPGSLPVASIGIFLSCHDRLACAVRVGRPFGSSVASLARQCMQQTDPHRQSAEPAQARRRYNPFPSISVLTAATIGPEVASAAVRVRAGDTRSACINTRATPSHLAAPSAPEQRSCHSTAYQAHQPATPSHLAAPSAPEQLPQHRIPGTSAPSVPRPTGVCCARMSAIRRRSAAAVRQ